MSRLGPGPFQSYCIWGVREKVTIPDGGNTKSQRSLPLGMWTMYSYCWSFLNLVIQDGLVVPWGTPGCRMSGCRNAYKPRFKNAGRQNLIVKLDVHKCESYVDNINIRNWCRQITVRRPSLHIGSLNFVGTHFVVFWDFFFHCKIC